MSANENHNKISAAAFSLLEEPDFLKELAEAAAETGKTPEQAAKYAHKCLREVAATPSESWLAPAARMARFIYTRSYEPELDINLPALESLKAASEDQLLLFLWSHKSHMDSFVFLLSLYENNFRPLPLVFAGINMNFLGFGTLARKVGAIFLRRSFQDDPIYKLVFRHYIDYLIRHRLPLTWSIEGTRSRTGKLSPPKLGILNWVLESCDRENMRDVKLVPVSIAFDRIAEIDDYVALQKGLPKRKESLRWFLNFVFGMKEPYGKIYVRYAEPVGLDTLDTSEISSESASSAARLAFEVCTRIEQITPIKSADVLAMVLLAANGRAMTLAEVLQQAKQIVDIATERQLPVARGFSLKNEDEVAAALLAMSGSRLIKSFDKGSTPVVYIPEEEQLAAAYYRNTITHYFLAAALGEVALAQCDKDVNLPDESTMKQRVEALRDLYKFDFFFKPRDAFWTEVKDELGRQYPNWSDGSRSLARQLRDTPPRFGHAILRSIAEAHLVTANALLTLDGSPCGDQKKFIARLLDHGREMLLRRQISGDSTLSKDLFSSALRLTEHLQLLEGDKEALRSRRIAFERQTYEVLEAINLLQESYDRAWFDPVRDH